MKYQDPNATLPHWPCLRSKQLPHLLSADILQKATSIFAAKVNSHIRSVDIPSGTGNRLNLLLPTTDEAGTRAVCERLISIFKSKVDNSITFSLQIGASSHPGGSTLTGDFLLQKAEEALAQSKLKGPHTYVLITK
jgi:GGDEF domain-containing protein